MVLVASVGLLLWTRLKNTDDKSTGRGSIGQGISDDGSIAALRLGSAGSLGPIDIEIRPMAELDLLTRKEVLAKRKEALVQVRDLFDESEYRPAPSVFAQIEDGAPWWGIDGIYRFGPGVSSISGPAEESRWLLNPFLVVGVQESNAWVQPWVPSGSWQPELVGIRWHPRERLVRIDYDLSNHVAMKTEVQSAKIELGLATMNAQDFGMRFIQLDLERSQGVVLASPERNGLRQYLHRGGSCGFAGGCNNGSPGTPELDFELTEVPAVIYGRLWAEPSEAADADLDFEIHLRASKSTESSRLMSADLCVEGSSLRTCVEFTSGDCVTTLLPIVESCLADYPDGYVPIDREKNWRKWGVRCALAELFLRVPYERRAGAQGCDWVDEYERWRRRVKLR